MTADRPGDVATPDAVPRSTVDWLPASARPYARLARLDRPIGSWLLYWPCAWGVALAGGGPRGGDLGRRVGRGARAMRGAGCVYNDIVDRRLDASVERTRDRPVASGRISVRKAWNWLFALSLIGLVVLIQLRPLAQGVALASLALVAAYPFMKRLTWWPQAWLGLTFNWGALVAWPAATGRVEWPALALYAAGISWTLGYDTIYALQDIEDDALAGIRSSARRLGGRVRGGIALFYVAATAMLGVALITVGGAWAALGTLPVAAHFAWQVLRLRPGDPRNALRLFRSNSWAGALVFLACAAAGS